MEEAKPSSDVPGTTGRAGDFKIIKIQDQGIEIPNWVPIALVLTAVLIGFVLWRRGRRTGP
jgi:multisubunit Na+/H+ antiporter MnhC subunit